MMPGIIIFFIFSKQGTLFFRAFPLQNQLAGAQEPLQNGPNWLGGQISAADLPGSTRSPLFAHQQTALNQPLNRTMADATDASGFVQTHSVRIG